MDGGELEGANSSYFQTRAGQRQDVGQNQGWNEEVEEVWAGRVVLLWGPGCQGEGDAEGQESNNQTRGAGRGWLK